MILTLVLRVLDIYGYVVLGAVLISWLRLSPDNPIVRFLRAATEPLLAPIRRVLPSPGGIDLSAMALLLGIHVLRRLLVTFL